MSTTPVERSETDSGPIADDEANDPRAIALSWATAEERRHHRKARVYWWTYVGLQALTIVSAGVATVTAVADPEDIDAVVRAIPAAIATLSAAFMAAFHPRGVSRRHLRSWRLLQYEILKFKWQLREYRPTEPRPQREGIDLFLQKVETITLAGDDEPEAEETVPEETVPQGQAGVGSND